MKTSETDPDGHATVYGYNTNGNQRYAAEGLGRQITATYNSLNEPLTQTDGNGVTTAYTYDANGNAKTVSTPLAGTSPQLYKTTTYSYGDTSHPGDITGVT